MAFTSTQSFADEMQYRKVFVLKSSHARYFEPTDPLFGLAVENAFPLSSEDICEAGMCLSLGRNTATAFHLMRAMEAAIQSLALQVGVLKIDKSWGPLLSDIGTAIEQKPKGAERDRWSESHSHLYHVKQAWRNDTMHPKKTYSDDQAEALFAAVRSFMIHLAELILPAPALP